MAARFVLLVLFMERQVPAVAAGLLKEERDLQSPWSRPRPLLPHLESNLKDSEIPHQNVKGDAKTLPRTVGKPNNLGFKADIAAKSLLAEHSLELTLNRKKRSTLTNEEVEGVINARRIPPSSEDYASLPDLHLETGVSGIVLRRTRQSTKWVRGSEDGGPRSRHRRSWLWNQFFVIEEYRGPEPVLIGRVRGKCFCVMSYSTQICVLLHVPARPDLLDPVCLACCTLHSFIPKKPMTASLETTSFSEHNPQRFFHPFSGQTAHLHRVSLTGLVYAFPLGPLTSQTDDLMQIEVASLASRVV